MAKSNRKTKHVEVEQVIEQPTQHNVVEATTISSTTPTSTNTKKVEPIVLNKEQQIAFTELKTVSAKIRYLHAEKFTRGQIAVFLNKKYQHVRNVLITPLKKEIQ